MSSAPTNTKFNFLTCKPENWKSSLLMGSVLTWMLGVVIFGMSIASLKKPIFDATLRPYLQPIFNSLGAAIGAAVFICLLAMFAYCAVAMEKPKLLQSYVVGLAVMFLYQSSNGASLIYHGQELFTVVQYVSIEVCREGLTENTEQSNTTTIKPRFRLPGSERFKAVADRLSRAMKESPDFNKEIAKVLNRYEKDKIQLQCPPVKDLITPIGSLLIFCSISYLYLALCAFKLAIHLVSKADMRLKMEGRVVTVVAANNLSNGHVAVKETEADMISVDLNEEDDEVTPINSPISYPNAPPPTPASNHSISNQSPSAEYISTPRPRPNISVVSKPSVTPAKLPTVIVRVTSPKSC